MHQINGTNILLTRGDTLMLQLSLTKNGEPYIPQEGDRIRFALKQKYTDPDEEVKVVRSIPIDTLILKIEPEDTKNLVMGKTYVYDIEMTDSNGVVDTFITGKFGIDSEVL